MNYWWDFVGWYSWELHRHVKGSFHGTYQHSDGHPSMTHWNSLLNFLGNLDKRSPSKHNPDWIKKEHDIHVSPTMTRKHDQQLIAEQDVHLKVFYIYICMQANAKTKGNNDCVYVYIYTYAYAYIYIYTHTNIYI